MTEENNPDDTNPERGISTNPFAQIANNKQFLDSLSTLQSIAATQDTAMQRAAKLLSEESMGELQRAVEILDEYDDAIWTTHQLSRLFDKELSSEIEQLATTVGEVGGLSEALIQNPVTIPTINIQLIDPELLDLMVSDFANGPLTEPLVRDSFDVDPNQKEVSAITPEEWVEMGIEAEMIITCGNCGSAVLKQNSHRYHQQEDGRPICPHCRTTGRSIQ